MCFIDSVRIQELFSQPEDAFCITNAFPLSEEYYITGNPKVLARCQNHCIASLWFSGRRSILFAIGGQSRLYLKEVSQYSLSKNKRKIPTRLSRTSAVSSAVVLQDVVYNIGGFNSFYSVLNCDLASAHQPQWKASNLAGYGFQ